MYSNLSDISMWRRMRCAYTVSGITRICIIIVLPFFLGKHHICLLLHPVWFQLEIEMPQLGSGPFQLNLAQESST